jgi:hypothetical protein
MLSGTILFVISVATFVFVMVMSSFYSVSGAWEKIEDLEEREIGKETISLGQFGPIVVGRRELQGGRQAFFGVTFAGTVWLKRRDYGSDLFIRQGFPKEIVKQLEGQIFVRLKLHLSKDNLFLNGVFIPYKIEFTHTPPELTGMHALSPISRRYRRAELILVNKSSASVSAASK